ncbi:MAG: hypothetical protein V1746_02985 [bacterium]
MKKKILYEDLTKLNGEPLPDVSKFGAPIKGKTIGLPSANALRRARLGHGGARCGAGRKPAGRIQYVTRLRPTLIRHIKTAARKAGKSECEMVESLLQKTF